MKKLIYTLGTVMLCFSCNLLDQELPNTIPAENAIVDRVSAEAAVIGLYNEMQAGSLYGSDAVYATELLAKNMKAVKFQAVWQELGSGIVPSANFHVEDSWIAWYSIVNNANNVILKVPELNDVSESDAAEFTGTAFFSRALAHFELLRQWGEYWNTGSDYGIPLPTEPATAPVVVPRSSVASAYALIESDLFKAIDRLPDSGDPVYASKGAAEALMARVKLYKGEYDSAYYYANDVIENFDYSLQDNYEDIFNEGTSESIFEVDFNQQDFSNYTFLMFGTEAEIVMTDEVIDLYQSIDERRNLIEAFGNFYRCTKYGTNQDNGEGNAFVMRLAEMYLIRAEALSRNSGPTAGLADINVLRERAGIGPVDAATVNSINDFSNVLIREARLEFQAEGVYWYYLSRLDKIQEVLNRDSFRRIYPIPLRELNITDDQDIFQNPGY
ncbi:RagB/SusD family nutrient uptake outer membrane protein [Marinigracilibium pacificum]|uniref:RagB/SusD family nutrient uptake outer membrane protein n=1 Tax=Marinigracilibium pacificum TaxID=2729599 RepID=A0A848IZW4_9BACT|nr:RagB/SusD family nutrient uptake outer membrane protein [Marinigracilibium pacificum]NMM48931.1 RagB/SusD family nutrient uptake outer membrane protein [Marinigracilibium pacificum]